MEEHCGHHEAVREYVEDLRRGGYEDDELEDEPVVPLNAPWELKIGSGFADGR